MKARKILRDALMTIPEFERRVHFMDRTSDAYPCVVYTKVGYRDLRLMGKPGVPYAVSFTVDVRSTKMLKAEELANKVYQTLLATGKLEERLSINSQFDDVDSDSRSQADPYGVYREIAVYTIRGSV